MNNNPILDQMRGGDVIGEVRGKVAEDGSGFAYYELKNGMRGPLTPVDAAALTIDALKPYLQQAQQIQQPQQPDRWDKRFKRATQISLTAAGLTLTIAGCLAIDAIRGFDGLRREAQTKWEQEVVPRIDNAMQRYDNAEPTLDKAQEGLDDLQERVGEMNEALDGLKDCTKNAEAFLDCINPLK